MPGLSWSMFIFYSIPESIVLMSFASVLYGYKLKGNFYRIILLGTIMAILSAAFRASVNSAGIFILFELIVFICLTSLLLKISFLRAIFFILTSAIIIMVGESLSYPFVSFISKIPVADIQKYPALFMVTGWVHLTGIIIVSFFIYKKGVTLDRTARFFQTKTKRNKTRVLVTALILGQVVVAGVLNTYQLMNDTNYSTGFLVSGLLLILTALMSGYFIRKMFLQSEQDVVLETYESFIDNINTLYTTVRGQRHDFIHHAQVLFSMITTGQPKEAEQYLAQLIGEIQEVNELIKVKNPVLNSLLNSKMAVAAGKNTKLSAVIKTNLDNCRIRPLDLVKVLGNLIDNALDAVQNQPQEYKKANVLIKEESGIHVFEVTNPRPLIPPVVISRIFETGFSTKKDHTGLGLAVTKEIITRLGGNINVRSNPEEGTVFTVVVPVK